LDDKQRKWRLARVFRRDDLAGAADLPPPAKHFFRPGRRICRFHFQANQSPLPSRPERGAYHDRHLRGKGMRWTPRCQARQGWCARRFPRP